ncbi:MAG: formylglycine-generating enzyme family protein [Polyangiaceae bacterium]
MNQPCAVDGDTACQGHAKKQQLICSAGKWVVNGTCTANNNCDTTPGTSAGSCQPILAACAAKAAGTNICDGSTAKTCGPDLVTGGVLSMCTGGFCNGAGVCGECQAETAECTVGGLRQCSPAGVWGAASACPSTAPVCTAGACVNPPSCVGLPATCGAAGNESCCRSGFIPGVAKTATTPYYRSYDGVTAFYLNKGYPASVSAYNLDNYPITVGRFSKFASVYLQNMTVQGAGKNPNDPNDTGWDAANWNGKLDASQTDLKSVVACDAFATFNAGNPNMPMNCLSWYEAEAFCIWDGGRLPTELEWNFAASGGTDQNIYPWGSTKPGMDATLAVYGCYLNGTGACSGLSNLATVGSLLAGNGKFGQADLAGNVVQWLRDYGNTAYVSPCDDCSQSIATAYRGLRGASYNDSASFVFSSGRNYDSPIAHKSIEGARCARTR